MSGVDGSGLRVATSKDLNASSQIVTAILVEWGGDDPEVPAYRVGYVNGEQSQTIYINGLGQFTALAELDIDMKKQDGGIKDVPIEIRMTAQPPFDIPAGGDVSQSLFVTVLEFDPQAPDFTMNTIFKGRVGKMTVNPDGLANVIEYEVLGGKEGLHDILMGMPANTTCVWALGDKTCKVGLNGLRETPTVVSISGKILTVDALAAPDSRFWERGYIRFEQLIIGIRSFNGGLTLELYRKPPQYLIGEVITVTPGCDKTITTCRARFDNEELFGGFGFAIPAYTPTFEST